MKRFLKITALFLLPVVFVCAVFFAALLRSGELIDARQAAAQDVTLFGLAYRDDTRSYKQAVAARKGADLLVLGTSRSMQFRGEFFDTDSFYNAGGGIAFMPQAPFFMQSLPKNKLPKHLLLVLDQYFFNEDWASIDLERDSETFTFRPVDFWYSYKRIFTDYADGKYRLLDVLQNPQGVYGVAAAGKGAGFYHDGSYSYGNAVLHPEKSNDANFVDTYERIRTASRRFEYGDNVSEPNTEALAQLLAFCAENDIMVTAIIPPYAPSVWKKMQESGNYTYMEKISPTLAPLFARYDFELFDYSYLPETNDAQYIDGFHGSDRVYAALCARLAQDSPSLAPLLDKDALTALFTADGNPLTVIFKGGQTQ